MPKVLALYCIASDWYRQIFPTRLSPQRAAMPEFDKTAQGCRLPTSVGGVLTGRGATSRGRCERTGMA